MTFDWPFKSVPDPLPPKLSTAIRAVLAAANEAVLPEEKVAFADALEALKDAGLCVVAEDSAAYFELIKWEPRDWE